MPNHFEDNPGPLEIRRVRPDDPAAQQLITASDQAMQALYPAESNHLESVQALLLPNVTFIGAYLASMPGGTVQELVGCGAVKVQEDGQGKFGEIKRLFVSEHARGKGISLALMAHLEALMADMGIAVSRLETGIRQPEALGLYKKLSYAERGPFGDYLPDPLSIFMQKHLPLP